jgi:hypothetical protein
MTKKNKRPASRFATTTAPAEFNPDYSTVKKDLARIGVLAAVFFVGLIVLSFFIK